MRNSLQPTDYGTLQRALAAVIQMQHVDYTNCVATLLSTMRNQFPALQQASNPVVQSFGKFSTDDLAFIIKEYSGFSNAAIHMFLEARIRNHWPALTEEIVRNMNEEMGTLTRNVPHLELMRHGYRSELGLETENLSYSAQTTDFIARMTDLFKSPDNAFLSGCLLAFEATAVEEFRIVERILRAYQSSRGSQIAADSLTGIYIAGHVTPETSDPASDPEMEHYRGMMEAVGKNIDGSNIQELIRGFLAVCLELNQWWEQLALCGFQRSIRKELLDGDQKSGNLRSLYQSREPRPEVST
jgi:hypothetical protein